MRQQTIATFEHIPRISIQEVFPRVEDYAIAPARWKWLTKIKAWMFRRIWSWCHPSKMIERETIQRTRIEGDKLLDSLRRHVDNVDRLLMGQRISTVVVGQSTWYELVNQMAESPMNFQLDGFESWHSGGRREIFGMNVVVVPWIDGMFVMPPEKP